MAEPVAKQYKKIAIFGDKKIIREDFLKAGAIVWRVKGKVKKKSIQMKPGSGQKAQMRENSNRTCDRRGKVSCAFDSNAFKQCPQDSDARKVDSFSLDITVLLWRDSFIFSRHH